MGSPHQAATSAEGAAWPLTAIYAIFCALALAWVAANPAARPFGMMHGRSAIFKRIPDSGLLLRGALLLESPIALIAFARVEGLLLHLAGEGLAQDLIRPQFIGPWVHGPMVALGFAAAFFTRTLGFIWLALLIVIAELLIVFSRFIFSYEQALMGDLVPLLVCGIVSCSHRPTRSWKRDMCALMCSTQASIRASREG